MSASVPVAVALTTATAPTSYAATPSPDGIGPESDLAVCNAEANGNRSALIACAKEYGGYDSNGGALSQCDKEAIAAGTVTAGAAAVTTTPVDIPGIVGLGLITAAGTDFFCSIGWL
jgi:hypothetical protein